MCPSGITAAPDAFPGSRTVRTNDKEDRQPLLFVDDEQAVVNNPEPERPTPGEFSRPFPQAAKRSAKRPVRAVHRDGAVSLDNRKDTPATINYRRRVQTHVDWI